MKTIDDLKNLLPTLIDLFNEEEHEIGESHEYESEDGRGWCDDYEQNCFTYEEDGWYVEVYYECCGEYCNDSGDYWNPPCYDLIRAWGRVTEINVLHSDEETGDETEFSKEDLAQFFAPFNELLEDIA